MNVRRSQFPTDIYEMMSEPHFPLGQVLMDNADAFRTMGLERPIQQRLGSGSFGTAYEIPMGNGSALKLTRDVSEAQAAVLLKGRESRRIVRVHDVWAVPGSFDDGLRGWYAVHRQLLTTLNKTDSIAVEILFQLYNDEMLSLSLPRSAKQHAMVSRWRSHVQTFVLEDMGAAVSVDDEGGVVAGGTGRIVKRAMQLLVQIGSSVDEMHRAGIDWEDIHPDNMMRTPKGTLVIGDIGYGEMHDDFSGVVPLLTHEVAQEYVASKMQPTKTAAS